MEEQKKGSAVTETDAVEQNVREAEVVTLAPQVGEEKKETEDPIVDKNVVFAFTAGLLVAFVGYFALQTFGTSEPTAVRGTGEAMTLVDPTVVVATVNGTELTGGALNQQLDQFAQLSGAPGFTSLDIASQEQTFSQAIDALINSELIAQAAAENGVTVSDEAVDAEYARLVEQIGGAEAAEERLLALNATVESFKKDLLRDMSIAKYLENEAGALAASEEEVQEAYARVEQSMGENTPALEEVRAQIEAQVMSEKQQSFVADLLQEMRENAEIEILI